MAGSHAKMLAYAWHLAAGTFGNVKHRTCMVTEREQCTVGLRSCRVIISEMMQMAAAHAERFELCTSHVLADAKDASVRNADNRNTSKE